ncbi:MAG TPA: phage portal protein, partial [Actinomycetales bacterium]|nr:phage portal protein [Actinomycetales bacterium]
VPIDADTPESDGWYLRLLLEQLHNRRVGRRGKQTWTRDRVASSRLRPGLELLAAYRRGDPPLRDDVHSGWAAPFRRYVRMGRLNFAGKLVSPTASRMGLRGFMTAAAADELGDEAARQIMRRNKLKTVASDVHDDMLSFGDGYALVTPPDDPEVPNARDWSLITAESPLLCITGNDPATGQTRAGLKVYRDEMDEYDWAYMVLPGGQLRVARKPGTSSVSAAGTFRFGSTWEWVEDKFDEIPGGRNPFVRFRNRRGVGEFEEHLDQLDRINDKIFNEWWIEKIQAFRQRALERDADASDDDDYDDREGQDAEEALAAKVTPAMSPEEIADMFVSAPDALWDLPPGTKLWESGTVDVNPMLNSIQKELQWLAAAADKPLASLNPDAANQSAAGSTNQKEEHLYQVLDRRDRAEAGWVEVMSHAFYFEGDEERADVTQLEALWGPLELYGLEEKAQAASQSVAALPREAIWRDIYQYDPAAIKELRQMDGRQMLLLARQQQQSQQGQPAASEPSANG